jgi:hypothetical protein
MVSCTKINSDKYFDTEGVVSCDGGSKPVVIYGCSDLNPSVWGKCALSGIYFLWGTIIHGICL